MTKNVKVQAEIYHTPSTGETCEGNFSLTSPTGYVGRIFG